MKHLTSIKYDGGEKKQRIVYFRPDETQLIFNNYVYHIARLNKNTIRWRCIICKKHSLITKGNFIFTEPLES